MSLTDVYKYIFPAGKYSRVKPAGPGANAPALSWVRRDRNGACCGTCHLILLCSLEPLIVANYRKLGVLQQQKLILLRIWRPEAWNQGVSTAVLPFLPLPGGPWPVAASLRGLLHRHTAFSPRLSSSSCKDVCRWIWGPPGESTRLST